MFLGDPKGEVVMCQECNRCHDISRGTGCICACGTKVLSKNYSKEKTIKNLDEIELKQNKRTDKTYYKNMMKTGIIASIILLSVAIIAFLSYSFFLHQPTKINKTIFYITLSLNILATISTMAISIYSYKKMTSKNKDGK